MTGTHDEFASTWSLAAGARDYDPELDRSDDRSDPAPVDADELREREEVSG